MDFSPSNAGRGAMAALASQVSDLSEFRNSKSRHCGEGEGEGGSCRAAAAAAARRMEGGRLKAPSPCAPLFAL